MAVRVKSLLRLSTKKQAQAKAEKDLDIPGQRRAIAEFLQGKPSWALVGEYVEIVSASKVSAQDRDVLQEAIRDAKAGEYDILLLWKNDRLSRKSEEYPAILTTLHKCGVQVWSALDGKPLEMRTHQDKLLRFVEGWTAEGESRTIRDRVREKLKQIAQDGRWTGGRVPFGYHLVTTKDPVTNEPILRRGKPVREVVPHPDHASLLRQMFERYAQGQGIGALARWLNLLGIPSWKGGSWSHHAIRVILGNPFYIGRITYRRTQVSEDDGRKLVKTDRSTWIETEGTHTPLVSLELWESVQQLRDNRKRVGMKHRGGPYIFSGILKCPDCGEAMYAYMVRVKRRDGFARYPVYRCSNRVKGGTCSTISYREADLERSFLEVLDMLYKPSGVKELLEGELRAQAQRQSDAASERQRVQERMATIDGALRRLTTAYLEAGTVSHEEYRERKDAYHSEKHELEQRLLEPVASEPAVDVGALAAVTMELRKNWDYMTPEEKKVSLFGIVRGWHIRLVAGRDAAKRAFLQVEQ